MDEDSGPRRQFRRKGDRNPDELWGDASGNDDADDRAIPYSGRSVHCSECGYEGPPIQMLRTKGDGCLVTIGRYLILIGGFIFFGIGVLFSGEQELEDSCPNCGADQFFLTRRRGPVSEEAWRIYEAAEQKIVKRESRRRHIAILILVGMILGVVGIIVRMFQ